ncbi:hypothetical protein [Helicobacter macacae]|uniref:hypothetical protein n=1 Tax=Helicobacter macacae TaxID=398626 RepID=UPI0012EC914B|nr:hypothetical protein [Helicobacter macacae]
MRSCDLPLPKSLPQGEGLFFDYPLRVGNPADSPSLVFGVSMCPPPPPLRRGLGGG